MLQKNDVLVGHLSLIQKYKHEIAHSRIDMFRTLLDLGVVTLPRHNSICIGDVLDQGYVNHLIKSFLGKKIIPWDKLLDLGLVRTLVSVQVGFCPRASMPPPRNHGRAAFYKIYSENQV